MTVQPRLIYDANQEPGAGRPYLSCSISPPAKDLRFGGAQGGIARYPGTAAAATVIVECNDGCSGDGSGAEQLLDFLLFATDIVLPCRLNNDLSVFDATAIITDGDACSGGFDCDG